MIVNLFISAIAGMLLHYTRKYTDILPRGWKDLTNYSIGIVGTFPLFIFWLWRLKSVSDWFDRAMLAFLLAFIGVGSGVASGWLFDTFCEANHETF